MDTNMPDDYCAILFYDTGWIQNLTVSVNRFTPAYLNLLLNWLWLLGILAYAVITFVCNYNIRAIKQSVYPIKNKDIENIFIQCKADLTITKNIMLGESALIKTPMAIGLLKTYIILPSQTVKSLPATDIQYILLHELNHYKNKDILINYGMCFLQILYWFNPLVHLAFKEVRIDREIACDASVLKMVDKSNYGNYGRTIINFIEKMSSPPGLPLITNMGGSKQQIKKRIEKIASFKKDSKQLKIKSAAIFLLISFLIASQAPAISSMAYTETNDAFEQNQITFNEDSSFYYNEFEGVSEMNYTTIEREPFKVIGIRRTTPQGGGTWAIVKSDGSNESIKELTGHFYDLGLCFGFGEDGSDDYMCAVEWEKQNVDGLDVFEYPAATWLKFEAKGTITGQTLGNVWQVINNEFLPQSKYKKSELPTIEKYIIWDDSADTCHVEIWIPVTAS